METFNRPPTNVPPVQSPSGILFQYRSLDQARREIRLVKVHPGYGEGEVKCSIRHLDLQAIPVPFYETLSYAWGDPFQRTLIELDGIHILVAASSEAAIRRVRLSDKARLIWIDAVCINQHDVAERGRQVSLMSQIYLSSGGNLIHFREVPGNSRALTVALQNLDMVLDQVKEETDGLRGLRDVLYDEEGIFRTPTTPLSPRVDTETLVPLFSCSWFRRLWVLQEAALAPQNTCLWGPEAIDLGNILIAAAWIGHKAQLSPSTLVEHLGRQNAAQMFDIVDREHGYYRSTYASLDLINIIDIGRQLLASESRDFIYAILGILPEKALVASRFADLLVPDYTKPLRIVLCNATRFAIAERGDLYPLQFVSHRADWRSDSGIPSWIVRADRPFDSKLDPRALFGGFRAGGNTKVDLDLLFTQQTTDAEVLSLRGAIISTVTKVDDCMEACLWNNETDLIENIARTRTHVCGDESILNTAETTKKLAVALVANASLDNSKGYSENISALCDCLTNMLDHPGAAIPQQYGALLWKAIRNRQVFCTGSGLVGIGPRHTRIGDLLVVLHGATVPYVLRQLGPYYQLLGQAFLGGMMTGEALQIDPEGQRKTTVFNLQ